MWCGLCGQDCGKIQCYCFTNCCFTSQLISCLNACYWSMTRGKDPDVSLMVTPANQAFPFGINKVGVLQPTQICCQVSQSHHVTLTFTIFAYPNAILAFGFNLSLFFSSMQGRSRIQSLSYIITWNGVLCVHFIRARACLYVSYRARFLT